MSKEKMKRVNIGGTRHYTYKGELGISVTEFLGRVYPLSPHLKDWWIDNSREYVEKTLKDTSAFGDEFHNYAEDFAKGTEINIEKLGSKMQHYMTSLAHLFHSRNIEPIHIEQRVFHSSSEQYPLSYGGTLDLECYMDFNGKRVRALLDYKSGNIYDKHKFQLIAYLVARKQFDSDLEHLHLFNFSPNNWRTSPSGTLKHWTYNKKDLETFSALCTLYSNEIMNLPKTVRVFNSVTSGFAPEYEDMELWDYIEQYAETT